MRLLLIKERLFLFGEFAVSETQCLYNNEFYHLSIIEPLPNIAYNMLMSPSTILLGYPCKEARAS